MKKLVLFVFFILCTIPVLAQNTITFAWDISVDDAALGASGGYRIYGSKTTGVYTGPAKGTVGRGITTMAIPRPGLGKWYFVATAFDSDGNESDYSNEVSTVIKPKPPTLKTATVAILTSPITGITKLAGLTKKDKSLRIINRSFDN